MRSVALLGVFLDEERSVKVTHYVEFDAESFKLLVVFAVKLVLNIKLGVALVGGAVSGRRVSYCKQSFAFARF